MKTLILVLLIISEFFIKKYSRKSYLMKRQLIQIWKF